MLNPSEVLTRFPSGKPPSQGWPAMVFLHGCGERVSAYTDHVAFAAEKGFAAFAPAGPIFTSRFGRSWSSNLADTNECVQAALKSSTATLKVDANMVYLCGFSQGATHAYALLATWPDRYRGAIVLSLGEGPEPEHIERPIHGLRPLYVACGSKEFRQFRQRAKKWAARCRRAGQPCVMESHEGGHHFPVDWAVRFPQIVSWLAQQSNEENAL
jgi:predicted esterase